MRLECEHCGRSFDLPEHKVPEAASFRFTCPGCRQVTEVHREVPEAGTVEPKAQQELQVQPERVPPGTRLALVCVDDPDLCGRILEGLQGRNWHVLEAAQGAEGAARLRVNQVQLLIVQDGESGAPVLHELSRWPGRERRRLNCVLVGNRTESFDSLTAFVLGVNSYVHQTPAQGMEAALQQAEDLFAHTFRMWSTAGENGA